MTKSRFSIVVAAMTIMLGGTACHSQPSTTPQSSATTARSAWPAKLSDFRFLWSAESDIALDTGWAVPLRAYMESWRVMLYTDNLDAAYPGFKRATPALLQRYSPEWSKAPVALRDVSDYHGETTYDDPNQRFVGNEDLRVLTVEPIATGFRAFVCDSTFRLYLQQNGESKFTPLRLEPGSPQVDTDFANMKVWRVEFTDRDPRVGSTPPASPPQPQRGPLPAPLDDVFGPWFVTGSEEVGLWSDFDFPGLTPGSPEARQRNDEARASEETMRQQCLTQYPLSADQRRVIATTVLDKPPAVEPAVPGWPA